MINYQKLNGLIGLATKAGKISAGTEACIETIENRNAKLVLLATNASDRTKELFKNKCKKFNIPIFEIMSIEDLSKAIGKTNKAIICIKENGLAEAISKILIGGEVIG